MTARSSVATSSYRSRQGIALVTALIMVVVVGVVVLGSIMMSIVNLRVSDNDARVAQAVNVAQAGAAYWKAELVSVYKHMIENFELYEDALDDHINDPNNPPIACGNYLALGLDLNRDGTIETSPNSMLTPHVSVPMDGTTGTTQVTFFTDGANIVLDARGEFAGARARIVERFSVGNINVWNNAVFADNNAAQATIRGRAEIRGAVHILGTGLTSSDVALDVSGNFALGNTYQNLNPSLDVDPSSIPLTQPDPFDLCATLRVKRGYVEMDGSSQIGHPDAGDEYQRPMRGIYTNDGIPDGVEGGNVFSLNGKDAAYDSGDNFSFPELNEEMVPGGQTYAQAMRDNALVVSPDSADNDAQNLKYFTGSPSVPVWGPDATDPPSGTGTPYLSGGCLVAFHPSGLAGVGPIMPVGSSSAFPAGESTYTLHQRNTPSFSCTKYRISSADGVARPASDEVLTELVWNRTAGSRETTGGLINFQDYELYVGGTGGVVMFDGANVLVDGGNGSNDRINYRGNGILFAESVNKDHPAGAGGSFALKIDYLPTRTQGGMYQNLENDDRGAIVPGTQPNTYPHTTVMSLVARDQVKNDGAQKRFATTIYAGESVALTRQTLVVGAIVTRLFDAGSNVPTVLYVPNVAERMSNLIPGRRGNTYVVSDFAWVRR